MYRTGTALACVLTVQSLGWSAKRVACEAEYRRLGIDLCRGVNPDGSDYHIMNAVDSAYDLGYVPEPIVGEKKYLYWRGCLLNNRECVCTDPMHGGKLWKCETPACARDADI